MAEGIGSNIKELIAKKGITQSELAKELGVSSGTLSDWIKGRYYPRHRYLVRMAEYFGVTPLQITAKKDTIPPDDGLVSLFNSLSTESKEKAIDYMKYLLHKGQE